MRSTPEPARIYGTIPIMDADTLHAALAGLPVPEMRFFDAVGSTNAEALQWAAQGAPDGALVVADAQSAGRGRLGRRWITPPGAALAFSLVLRLHPEDAPHAALYSPLGALAVCEALERGFGLAAAVKWPNDVLLSGRKVCGVLAETGVEGSLVDHVVLGIGVNTGLQSVPPQESLRFPAASVESALGRPVERAALLAAILRAVFAWRGQVGGARFVAALNERLAFRGRQVHILHASGEGGGAVQAGRVVGFAPDGSLILQTDAGERCSVTAGDVSLRPSAPAP